MVHVSDAGGRHKTLAFATEPNINTINSVKEEISSSRELIKSNNTLVNITNLSIITEEASNMMNNILEEATNGNENDNGNVSFLPLHSPQHPQQQHQQRPLELDELSDGENSSLLINGSPLTSPDTNNISNNTNNKVLTDENIISNNTTTTTTTTKGKKMRNGKTISSNNTTTTTNTTSVSNKEWSQSQDSEEAAPLLLADESIDTTTTTTVDNTNPNINLSSAATASTSAVGNSSTHSKHGKLTNGGTKQTGLKRVSFGSSKGSMVETLIFESPVSEEPETSKTGNGANLANGAIKSASSSHDPNDSLDSNASGGSTGGSRPPSRVRVTFFESEKPLAVSSPESDIIDFDLSNMTLPGSPSAVDRTPPAYNRQMSTESGWDNPFRPDGDLSKEADQIVELIKEGKPINDETLRSKSPSVNETMNSVSYPAMLNASPKGKGANGTAPNGAGGSGSVEVQHGVVAPAANAGQVEHVVIKKKKGCCVIQ